MTVKKESDQWRQWRYYYWSQWYWRREWLLMILKRQLMKPIIDMTDSEILLMNDQKTEDGPMNQWQY